MQFVIERMVAEQNILELSGILQMFVQGDSSGLPVPFISRVVDLFLFAVSIETVERFKA